MTIPFDLPQAQMTHKGTVISAVIFGCRENGEKIGIQFLKFEIYFQTLTFL